MVICATKNEHKHFEIHIVLQQKQLAMHMSTEALNTAGDECAA